MLYICIDLLLFDIRLILQYIVGSFHHVSVSCQEIFLKMSSEQVETLA